MSQNLFEVTWMSPLEVSRLLQIKPRTLAEWRSQRKGPNYYKVGAYVRYREADVRAWLEARPVVQCEGGAE